jgi:hypothetical protein
MFDRLISGAGAVSHAAGRLVRGVGLGQRPASMSIAAVLGVAAVAGFVVGLDRVDPTLRTFTAGELASGDHGDRAFANVSGSLAAAYVETFRDDNLDGQQQPEEKGLAWNYFLVDATSKAGLTVQSKRSPAEVYEYTARGIVVEDETYVAEDVRFFQSWLAEAGITLDPSRYVDATREGTPTKVAIADGLPPNGTAVEIEGSRAVDYLTVCSTDTNDDGVCSGDEIDRFDVVVYDPLTKKGVTVLTSDSPEFSAAGFSGMLRRAPNAVAMAQKTSNDEFRLSDLGITVSPDYILTEGDGPSDLIVLVPLALMAGLAAAVIAIGVGGGYLRFRPGGTLPHGPATLPPGGRIPVHITGNLRSQGGLVDVREVGADLVRLEMTPIEGAPPPSAPTTLIIERRDRPEGVAVGRGELTAIESGAVTPFRGSRPALRLNAGTGRLLVSFDSVQDRDRAAAELGAEAGIGQGGS